MAVSWLDVLRDALVVLLLIFAGDWLVRTALGVDVWLDVRSVVRILIAGGAFAVIGGWQPERRVRHIALVGVAVWLATLVNLIGSDRVLGHWILGAIPIIIGVALGCAAAVAMGALRPPPPIEDEDTES